MGKRGCACVCAWGGVNQEASCSLCIANRFGGELIHFLGSGIRYSLNTFLFPLLLVRQAQRHKGNKCGADFFVAYVLILPTLHGAKSGEKQGDGFMPSPLCSLTSRQCPGHGQMGTSGQWPCLDVVWAAFETVSLLAGWGWGWAVCGFKTESLLNQLWSWARSCLPGDVSVSALR